MNENAAPETPREGPFTARGESHAYEFSERENVLLAKLAGRMRFVGLFAIGIGILVVASSLFHHYHWSVVSGIFYAVIGIWTHRASISFQDMVETKGHDISHLMHALDDLRKLYTFQYWLCFLALVISLGVLIGTIALIMRGG